MRPILDLGELDHQRSRNRNLQHRQLPQPDQIAESRRRFLHLAAYGTALAQVQSQRPAPGGLHRHRRGAKHRLFRHGENPLRFRRVPSGRRVGRRAGRSRASKNRRFARAGNRRNYYRRHDSHRYRSSRKARLANIPATWAIAPYRRFSK